MLENCHIEQHESYCIASFQMLDSRQELQGSRIVLGIINFLIVSMERPPGEAEWPVEGKHHLLVYKKCLKLFIKTRSPALSPKGSKSVGLAWAQGWAF